MVEIQEKPLYLDQARDQQIDPLTGDLYPWWIVKPQGEIKFDPNKFDPSHPYQPRGRTFCLKTNPDPERRFEDPFDLENLRIIDPKEVRETYRKLVQSAERNPHKNLAVLIGTGGTLSMRKTQEGLLEPQLSPEDLMHEAGNSGENYAVAPLSFPTMIDSSQMEIDYAADLVIATSWIYAELAKDKKLFDKIGLRFKGFIICHGTDTVCQAQTFFSFMQGPNCPFNAWYVVAQTTTENPLNDVGVNLRIALEAGNIFTPKQNSSLPRIGVHGICAGGTSGGVYNGPTSKKISDREVELINDYRTTGPMLNCSDFGTRPNIPFERPSADLQKLQLSIMRDSWPREYKQQQSQLADTVWFPLILRGYKFVEEIRPQMGDDPKEIGARIRRSKARAILVETFGSFTVNRKIVDAMMRAAWETDKMVFATNPFPTGSTEHIYADSNYLSSKGVIPLNILAHSAYAKLLVASAIFGDNRTDIIRFMMHNEFHDEQLVPRSEESHYRTLNTGDREQQNNIIRMNLSEVRRVILANRVRILQTVGKAAKIFQEYDVEDVLDGNSIYKLPPSMIHAWADHILGDRVFEYCKRYATVVNHLVIQEYILSLIKELVSFLWNSTRENEAIAFGKLDRGVGYERMLRRCAKAVGQKNFRREQQINLAMEKPMAAIGTPVLLEAIDLSEK